MSQQRDLPQSSPYLGSLISLISASEIRYEGLLYGVDTTDSTIALAKVRSYGTETRVAAKPVPAMNEVYEYIIFKAQDIKDLTVCQPPHTPLHDPAIVSVANQPPHPPSAGTPNNGQRWSSTNNPNGFDFVPSGPRPLIPQENSFSPQQPFRFQPTGHPAEDFPLRFNSGMVTFGSSSARGKDNKDYKDDYDFEKANKEFEKVEQRLDDKKEVEKATQVSETNVTQEIKTEEDTLKSESNEVDKENDSGKVFFYDKKRCFFDKISTDAEDRPAHHDLPSGGNSRAAGGDSHSPRLPSFRNQRTLNAQTFGFNAIREQQDQNRPLWNMRQPFMQRGMTAYNSFYHTGKLGNGQQQSNFGGYVDPRIAHDRLAPSSTNYFYSGNRFSASQPYSSYDRYQQTTNVRNYRNSFPNRRQSFKANETGMFRNNNRAMGVAN